MNHRGAALYLWMVALGAASLTAKGQAGASDARRSLLGTWALVSTEELLESGQRRPYPDLGPNAKGYLIYSPDGHMCATLMRPGRTPWKGDEQAATAAEKLNASDGFTSYCGTYTVDEKRKVIVHLPEIAFRPNYIGVPQERPYVLSGDRLTFSGVETTGGVARWTIVWQRTAP